MNCKNIKVAAMLLAFSSIAFAQQSVPSAIPPNPFHFIFGQGTSNFIPKFSSPSVIGNSKIFQANDGNIGIGTTMPLWPLHVLSTNTVGSGTYPPIALWAESTAPNTWGGVYAVASSTSGYTIALNGEAYSPNGIGVIGQGGLDGVVGNTANTSAFAVGVSGSSQGTTGPGVGVFGQAFSSSGIAGLFINRPGGDILQGRVNTVDLTVFRVDGTGRVFADGGFQPSGADFAESMAATGDRTNYAAGDLLVIDTSAKRRVTLAAKPYSTLVAGIYSTKPGVLGSTRRPNEAAGKDEVPLAVVGIVPCHVTAKNGAIEVGDLLVTSSIAGRAMKGTDRKRMLGAVVGKALEPLPTGEGTIQVLVTLQ
jgi:hypothetical protein